MPTTLNVFRSLLAGLWAGALLLLLLGSTLTVADEATLRVQTAKAPLRGSPEPFARILHTLSYGDTLLRRKAHGGWLLLEPESRADLEGWVHQSAVTARQIDWDAGDEDFDSNASTGDLALAGKGFDEEVETEYREDLNLDFTWVDRMSEYQVDEARKRAFLVEGGLEPEGQP